MTTLDHNLTRPQPSTSTASDLRELAEVLGSAVELDAAVAAGVERIAAADGLPEPLRWAPVPGTLFWWYPPSGDPVPQYRPDEPPLDDEGRPRKYLFPAGGSVAVSVPPPMVDRLADASTVLLVEGTKQHLAAVSHAPDDVVVAGVPGCWSWSTDGVPSPDLDLLKVAGRRVVLALDADVATNPHVHEAAARLAEHLEVLGAEQVQHLAIPAAGSAGLDDYLAAVSDRRAVLARLVDRAGNLPKPPARTRKPTGPSAAYFDQNGLRAVALADAVIAADHLAVGPDGSVWQYRDGRYHGNGDPLVGALRDLLGDRYRPLHRKATEELVVEDLRSSGRVLGDAVSPGYVNVANGMLEVATGKLSPHDPDLLSRHQLPHDWTPAATCPTFDAWLADRIGDQADDLLEALGLALCPWIGQRKVVFLYGPARSGKSTLLRLVELLVGPHKAAVTLHSLASNRFAAAELYGALVNVAGDLSDHHVDDLSLFKQLTGDDLVAGERKFRDAFTFHNRALFAFSANTPPTVSETSRAYLARVRPFRFPKSVEGHEDPTLDGRLADELPGILVRLVEGAQRWLQRGGYGPGDPLVAEDFGQLSDVAALFAADVLEVDPDGFVAGPDLWAAYGDWCAQNGRQRLGRTKFFARVENTLGDRQRREGASTGAKGWRGWNLRPSNEWGDRPDGPELARVARVSPTSPHEEQGEMDRGIPREGKVGPTRATRATGPLDPDEIITEEF